MATDNAKTDITCLQMEAVHEHITAGFFRVFSELGLTCNGHFNRRILQLNGDIFSRLSYPGVHVDYPVMEGRSCWDAIAARVRSEDPSLIFMNTLQRDGIAEWIEQFDCPVFAIVHNPKLFAQSEACLRWAESGRLTAFCLAPHVARQLKRLVPSLANRTFVHYAFDILPGGIDNFDPEAEVLDIVIPGAVNYRNRGFAGLIETLRDTGHKLPRPLRFTVIAGGPDRARLEADIASHDLQEYFRLMPLDQRSGRVPHHEYLDCLGLCHAIMPLLPHGRQDYLKSKVTSSVLAGLGAARPMICPDVVGRAYNFDPIVVPPNRPYDVSSADLSAQSLAERRQQGLRIRKRGLNHNRRTITRALIESAVLEDGAFASEK